MFLNLESIEDSLIETNPSVYSKLPFAGLYDPERPEIWYNPKRIIDAADFKITIIHEIMHHLEYDDYVPHNQFDVYASKYLKIKSIDMMVSHFFGPVIEKHWAKEPKKNRRYI
jgi:hypothetical protein